MIRRLWCAFVGCHDRVDKRAGFTPDGQELPDWMSWSSFVTEIGGERVTTGQIVNLPLIYYGPSIPMASGWAFGGTSSPPPTSSPSTDDSSTTSGTESADSSSTNSATATTTASDSSVSSGASSSPSSSMPSQTASSSALSSAEASSSESTASSSEASMTSTPTSSVSSTSSLESASSTAPSPSSTSSSSLSEAPSSSTFLSSSSSSSSFGLIPLSSSTTASVSSTFSTTSSTSFTQSSSVASSILASSSSSLLSASSSSSLSALSRSSVSSLATSTSRSSSASSSGVSPPPAPSSSSAGAAAPRADKDSSPDAGVIVPAVVAPVLGVGLILLVLALFWYKRRDRSYDSDDSFGSGGVPQGWSGVPTDDPDGPTSPVLYEKHRSFGHPGVAGIAGVGAGGVRIHDRPPQIGDEVFGGPIANIRDFEDDDRSVRTESTVSDEQSALLRSSRNGSQISRHGSWSRAGSLGDSLASINASTSSFGRLAATTMGAAVGGIGLLRGLGRGQVSSPSASRDSLNSPDTQRNVSGNTLEKHIGMGSGSPAPREREGSLGTSHPSSTRLGLRMSHANSSGGRTQPSSSDARQSSMEDDDLFFNPPHDRNRFSSSTQETEYMTANTKGSGSGSLSSNSSGSRSWSSGSKGSKGSFPRSTRSNRVSTIPEESTPMPTPRIGGPIATGAGVNVTVGETFGMHPNESQETHVSAASSYYESAESGDLAEFGGMNRRRRGPRFASNTSVDTFGGAYETPYDDDDPTVGRVPSLGRGSPARMGRGQSPAGPVRRWPLGAVPPAARSTAARNSMPAYIAAAANAAAANKRASLDSARTSYERPSMDRPSIEVRQPTLESELQLQDRPGARGLMQPLGGLQRRAAPPDITTSGAIGGDMMLSPFGPTTATPTGSSFSHATHTDWTMSSGNVSTGPSATRSLGDLGSVGSADRPQVRLYNDFGAIDKASRSAPSLRPSDSSTSEHGSHGSHPRGSRPRNRSRLALETTQESAETSEKEPSSSEEENATGGAGGAGGRGRTLSGAFAWLTRRGQ